MMELTDGAEEVLGGVSNPPLAVLELHSSSSYRGKY
jgi:hypothetical protein